MGDARFHVIYDGPAMRGSTIDVRDLAPALLALADVIEQANLTLNPGTAKVALRVNASFKSGCFGIDFSVVQGLLDQALGILHGTPVKSAKELLELLGFVVGTVGAPYYGVLKLIKWLRGRQIKEVVLIDDGRVRVVVDGESIETELATIELLRNFRLRQALEKVITEQLEREGFDTVAISESPEGGFIVIEKAERGYFIAPTPSDEQLVDETARANLQVVNVSFKDDNKWRFSDGSNSFHAAITDDAFLNRVARAEESFTAGDILTVQLRRRQWISGEAMKSEYEVVQVLDHRKATAQLRIPFRDDHEQGA